MTTVIIDFTPGGMTRIEGNGAVQTLIDIGQQLPRTTREDAAKWADWLLAEFWMRGFKVVPVEC